ncbi:MAG: hypothetical protein KDE20_20730, partial [Caldilineaceae bacterium]|nr:hypothetical protein [Caldilineaceae bacterium]
DSINGLRFTIGELVDDEVGNDAMSIDWYHADDDPEADPYLLRIDANPSGDRTIHAQGRAVTSALEYEDGDTGAAVTETNTVTKSTLTIQSETTDTANFAGNNAVRQAQLILQAQHNKSEYSGGQDDGLVELSKFSRATLSADNIIFSNQYSAYSQYGFALLASMAVQGGLIFMRDLPTSSVNLPEGAIYMDQATGALMVVQ